MIHSFYEGKSLNTALDDADVVVNECLQYGAQVKWSAAGALWAKAIAANFADLKAQIIQYHTLLTQAWWCFKFGPAAVAAQRAPRRLASPPP